MKSIRVFLKLILLSVYIIIGVPIAFLFLNNLVRKLKWYKHRAFIRVWLLSTAKLINCHIHFPKQKITRPSLVLSNHISLLDILIIGGCYEVQFLSKAEVAKWPFIGMLMHMSDTLLIKRGSGAQNATHQITHALQHNANICIFPEGTTSQGEHCLHFHSRLLKTAYLANSTISLLSISYSSNGKTRDLNMGWVKQSLWELLRYVLSQKRIDVRLNLVDTLDNFKEQPRKQLANQCQQAIEEDLKQNHYPCNEEHQ